MRQLVYHISNTRYNFSFYLRLIGSVPKHCKAPKHCDKDCMSLNRSRATPVVALHLNPNIFFDRVWHAGLLHKLYSGQIFGLIFSFDGFEWFWTGSHHKNIQLMLEFLKALFLPLYFSYVHQWPFWWCYL